MHIKNNTQRWWILTLVLISIMVLFTMYRCSEPDTPPVQPPTRPTPPTPPEPPVPPSPSVLDNLINVLEQITEAKFDILRDDEMSMQTAAEEINKIKSLEERFRSDYIKANLSSQEKSTIDKAQREAGARVKQEAVQTLVDYYEEEIDILYNVPPALKPEKMKELQHGRQRVLERVLEGILPITDRKEAEKDERVKERISKREEVLKRIKLTGSPI